MKYFKDYKNIVAIQENSTGGYESGSNWLETKTFPKETPIKDIIDWARYCHGRLIITIDEKDYEEKDLPF